MQPNEGGSVAAEATSHRTQAQKTPATPQSLHPARATNAVSSQLQRQHFLRILTLAVVLLLAIVAAGCSRSESLSGKTSREDALRQIATDYAASSDLAAAQVSLDKLKVANPAQLLVTLAESDLAAGVGAEEIKPLADLAGALGTHSPRLVAFSAPTAEPTQPPTATNTPVPPTATVAATNTAVPPTATRQPASPTAEPATATVEPAVTPQAIANGAANVRSGPGKNYPIIGKMSAGSRLT